MLSDDTGSILPSYKPHVPPLQNKLPQKVWRATDFLMEIVEIVVTWMMSSSVYSPCESGIWVLLTHRRYPSMSQRAGSPLTSMARWAGQSSVNFHRPSIFGNQNFPPWTCPICVSGNPAVLWLPELIWLHIHLKTFLMAACSTSAHEEITLFCSFPQNFWAGKGRQTALNMP